MKLSHIAQVLTIALLLVTSYFAWQARDESIKASTKVDLQTQQIREVIAQAAAQQASPNLVPGLTTPMSMPTPNGPPPLPKGAATASVSPPQTALVPAAPMTAPAGSLPSAPVIAEAVLTPLQRRVKDAPSIGAVKEFVADQGFVTLAAGTKNGLKEGMKFDLRREASVVGRVTITMAEEAEAIADLDPKSVPAGMSVKAGDELISVVLAQ